MAVLEIVKYGNPILSKVCRDVVDFPVKRDIIKNMYDTMYEAEGIGLAANQIRLDMNLFIIDITHTDETDETFEFVNAKIINSWGESLYGEGCLSIPDISFEVKRPEEIQVKYQTIDGTKKEDKFEGLMGRAIQHEIDHLNGFLITDRVSSVAKMQFNKKLEEIKNQSIFKHQGYNSKQNVIL
ncbi:peptide deformylase [Candidatus Neomarinimicrobiota bacterium]